MDQQVTIWHRETVMESVGVTHTDDSKFVERFGRQLRLLEQISTIRIVWQARSRGNVDVEGMLLRVSYFSPVPQSLPEAELIPTEPNVDIFEETLPGLNNLKQAWKNPTEHH